MPAPDALTARDPASLLLALSRRGRDIVAYRTGAGRGYLLNSPEHIAHVFLDRADNYSRDTFSHKMFESNVAEGLLTYEGERWRRERRIVEPVFRSAGVAGINGAVGRLMARWDDLAGGGEPCDIAHEMSLLALDLTVGALFGYELRAGAGDVGTAIANAVALLTAPDDPRFVEARSTVHGLVAQIVERRLGEREPRRDLLSLLLETREQGGPAVDDPVLRDRIVTFLLAGSQTTANALAWTLHLLAEHPAHHEQVAREVGDAQIPAVGDLPRLAVTRMVVQESMRLYPPAWIIGRRAIADDHLGGTFLPGGTTVALSPYTMHRHPRYWQHPDAFVPERFARFRHSPRFAFFPFGGGARNCIGARLAMTEVTLVIAALARHYRLEPVPGREVAVDGQTVLRPRDGVWATIERRRHGV